MDYIIGLIVALVGGFLYQRNKAQTAEALNQNVETKKSLNAVDENIAKNAGLEQSEEAKQAELQKELQNAQSKNETDLSALANSIDADTKKPS